MIDITVSGKILEVKKSDGGAGPSIKVVVQDRRGSVSEVWFFTENAEAFNEIKPSDS